MEKTGIQIRHTGRTLRRVLKVFLSAVLAGLVICGISSEIQAGGTNKQQLVFHRQNNQEMKIALTFDDGPHPVQTEKILNILRRYNVKATFFVIGKNVEQYPSMVKRIACEGHEIGNHTYSHPNLTEKSGKEIGKEIEAVERKLSELIGCVPAVLRPPGGIMTSVIKKKALEKGYALILWSIDTRDWAHTEADKMLLNIRKNISAGDIILFHDYISGISFTAEVLEVIIPELQAQGYNFVTVSELIG